MGRLMAAIGATTFDIFSGLRSWCEDRGLPLPLLITFATAALVAAVLVAPIPVAAILGLWATCLVATVLEARAFARVRRRDRG